MTKHDELKSAALDVAEAYDRWTDCECLEEHGAVWELLRVALLRLDVVLGRKTGEYRGGSPT